MALGRGLNSSRQKLSRSFYTWLGRKQGVAKVSSDVAEGWWPCPYFSQSSPIFIFDFPGRLWRTSGLWHQWPPNSERDCELGPGMFNEKQARCLHEGLILPELDSSPHWRRKWPSLLMTSRWLSKETDAPLTHFHAALHLCSRVLSIKCREEVEKGRLCTVCLCCPAG